MHYLYIHTTQSILNNPNGPQSIATKYKLMTWIWSLFCLQMSSHMDQFPEDGNWP